MHLTSNTHTKSAMGDWAKPGSFVLHVTLEPRAKGSLHREPAEAIQHLPAQDPPHCPSAGPAVQAYPLSLATAWDGRIPLL